MTTRAIFRQWFFEYRRLGYSPIPVDPITRKPCIVGWQVYCTRQATDQEINDWLKKFRKCNIALCGGYGGVLFLDVDDSFMLSILGQILTAETTGKFGSKGVTAFYRSDDVKSRAMGVDGRACVEFLGVGRNTTVPPSLHHKTGQPYTWVSPLRPAWELPALPANAAQSCYDALVTNYGHGCYGNPNPPVLIQSERRAGTPDGRMRVYAEAGLQGEVEKVEQTPQGGRANRLFQSACAIGKYVVNGVLTESEVIDAFMAAADANGLLAEDGAASVVAQVRSGISKAAPDPLPNLGLPTPEEVFGPASAVLPASAQPGAIVAFGSAAGAPIAPAIQVQWLHSRDLPPDEPELIQGLHSARPGNVSAISGVSGAGKTFYAVAMGLCVASGRPFLGRRMRYPEGAGVVYCAAEGEGTIAARVYAARLELQIPDSQRIPLAMLTGFGNLLEEPARVALMRQIAAISQDLIESGRGPVRQVILDTVSAGCRIESENDNSEAANICKMLRAMAAELSVSLEFLNHMGKNKDRGMRGGSAWRDNIDSGVSLSDGTLSILKSRNSSEGPFGGYTIESMQLDGIIDQWGETRNVGVLRLAEQAIAERLNMDDCFDAVAGDSNNASIIDINDEFKRRCDGNPSSSQRQMKSRWLKMIESGTSKRHFMANKSMIVRMTPETAHTKYGNSAT